MNKMIVIPMAGLSSRFFKAGFKLPKYMLMLKDETVFEWSVNSFKKYFDSDHFVFITMQKFDTPRFVEEKIQQMGIKSYEIVVLNQDTRGQADTVLQGIRHVESNEELYIFNIDSKLEDFNKLGSLENIDGYLEVFHGEGDHWSFVLPGDKNQVLKTTEKQRISSLCSNGLYYFKSSTEFKNNVQQALQQNTDSEIYIAPIYNQYIKKGAHIVYKEVQLKDINFCGTPQEYEAILQKMQEESQL